MPFVESVLVCNFGYVSNNTSDAFSGISTSLAEATTPVVATSPASRMVFILVGFR